MPFRVRRVVAVSPNVLWQALIDTRQWPKWGPSIIAVDCPDRFIVAGSRGRVRTAACVWLPFRITEFEDERFHYWHWNVCGVPATGHRLNTLTDSRTELIFEVPWAAAPYALVCYEAARRLAALSEIGQSQ